MNCLCKLKETLSKFILIYGSVFRINRAMNNKKQQDMQIMSLQWRKKHPLTTKVAYINIQNTVQWIVSLLHIGAPLTDSINILE